MIPIPILFLVCFSWRKSDDDIVRSNFRLGKEKVQSRADISAKITTMNDKFSGFWEFRQRILTITKKVDGRAANVTMVTILLLPH